MAYVLTVLIYFLDGMDLRHARSAEHIFDEDLCTKFTYKQSKPDLSCAPIPYFHLFTVLTSKPLPVSCIPQEEENLAMKKRINDLTRQLHNLEQEYAQLSDTENETQTRSLGLQAENRRLMKTVYLLERQVRVSKSDIIFVSFSCGISRACDHGLPLAVICSILSLIS